MSKSEFTGNPILLVEDETSLATGLEYNLTEEGYRVKIAPDGRKAIEDFRSGTYDLVILDIMLPYLDGFEVADIIREADPQIPILMLTARSAVQDRLRGLEAGADDYMMKPFHLDELLLRVRGMLRRKRWYQTSIQSNPVYRLGAHTIDFRTLNCRKGDLEFRLTAREAMLLKYLIEHEGRIVSRKELLEDVWQIPSGVETRTVDIFIARLRKYFEEDPKHPRFIESVRSAGYLFSSRGTESKS